MKRFAVAVLIVIFCLLGLARPVSAGAGSWTESLPIDAYGQKAYISAGFDWESNCFAWDGGGFQDGVDYWRDQVLDQSTGGQDPQANATGKFRGEAFWGHFSIGYITGTFGTGIISESTAELYRRLESHTGVPGEQYNFGERSILLSYQGISLGYTTENADSRWRWGVRCNLLEGTSYDENEYTGIATFTSSSQADAQIYQDNWKKRRPTKSTYNGQGYSLDFYARYQPASDWEISFAWEDLGRISWPEAVHYRQTMNTATETDVNGHVVLPVAYGNRSLADHDFVLNDILRLAVRKRYTGGDLTFGLEYREDELSWGGGWRINLRGENRLIFAYDDRFSGFGVGWENDDLSILLRTSSLRWNEAATVGLGMTWKI